MLLVAPGKAEALAWTQPPEFLVALRSHRDSLAGLKDRGTIRMRPLGSSNPSPGVSFPFPLAKSCQHKLPSGLTGEIDFHGAEDQRRAGGK